MVSFGRQMFMFIFVICIFLIILDRPITYLYNTLHFYERILRDRPSLKRKLVSKQLVYWSMQVC